MELDKSTPLEERQRLAARRTHEVRQKATESKIRAACRVLLQQAKPLAIAALATMSGLTRQTVATYRHVINETRESVVVALQTKPKPLTNATSVSATSPSQAITVLGVKYGTNQIPAVEGSTPQGQDFSTRPAFDAVLIDPGDSP
jgi:hypothetical protein